MSLAIKKILFPTDLSSHSRHAFQYAADLASRYDASVAILHVLEELPINIEAQLSTFLGSEEWKIIRERNMAETKEILVGKLNDKAKIHMALKSFWDDAKRGTSKAENNGDEIIVKEGVLIDTILEQAKISQCDIIVMAYYARNMLAEAMMNGITRRVLRRSKRPILLIPKEEKSQRV